MCLAQAALRRLYSSAASALTCLPCPPLPAPAGIFIASGPGVNALRAVRVVRLLRVGRHFHGLRRIVATLLIALPTIGNALLLVTLFLFIFSVLGCQLFYGERQQRPGVQAAPRSKRWQGMADPRLCYALLSNIVGCLIESCIKVHHAAACRRLSPLLRCRHHAP